MRKKSDGKLYHREGQELEFKEQFNFAGLAEYLRDFAGLANNRGGYMVFGVADKPREAVGLSKSSLNQFERIDPERITGFLLEIFSPSISWEQGVVEVEGKTFGVFSVREAKEKPVIAKKDEGKGQLIRNGEVYYRYGGRTQKIQYGELESIINQRIERNNRDWIDLVQKIGAAGPANAAILDTEKSLLSKKNSQIMVVDEELANKLKFIKEGEFDEKSGSPTLKLVGDVVPVDKVEAVRRVKENLTKEYPLSAMELASKVKAQYPKTKTNRIWNVIRENGIKENSDYSAYNFRNKKQEDEYREAGKLPATTPSIYKDATVDFIVNILRTEDKNDA